MHSGIQQIKLSRILGEMFAQAIFTFFIRVSQFIASGNFLSSSLTIAQRFSIGDRSGLFPGQTPFPQKEFKLFSNHLMATLDVWTGAPSCWKISIDMSGKSLRCKVEPSFSGSFEGRQLRFLEDLVNIVGSRHHLLLGQHMQLTQCYEAHKAPDLDFPMDAWLWRWGGTSSLSRAQIRSFWWFGGWNSSNGDSSEKSTLLHSSMPQDFLSLQNFTRLACWTAVNWDWSWGLKGKTFKDWRICLRTVLWETLWPFEVNLAANLQVDWALLVKLLEMVIFAAFKSFGFLPRPGVLVSSCHVWCFFHHLFTVRMDTPIPLATSDWFLPASSWATALHRVK